MSKIKTYLEEQAEKMGLSVEEYLNILDEEEQEENDDDFDLPYDWEPNYFGETAEEVRDQMNELRKLK